MRGGNKTMFECHVCKKNCDNAKLVCNNCLHDRELVDCFVQGSPNDVKNHLKHGRTVYGKIFGVNVTIVPDSE